MGNVNEAQNSLPFSNYDPSKDCDPQLTATVSPNDFFNFKEITSLPPLIKDDWYFHMGERISTQYVLEEAKKKEHNKYIQSPPPQIIVPEEEKKNKEKHEKIKYEKKYDEKIKFEPNKKKYTARVEEDVSAFKWRKYGRKIVKGSSNPKNYFKCTHPGCEMKKQVEFSTLPNGESEEIVIYIGKHSHLPPKVLKAFVEDQENFIDIVVGESLETEKNYLSSSSSPDKMIIKITNTVDFHKDGFHWRKYGQKKVEGKSTPRAYYRCSFHGCNVKKQVNLSETNDITVVYEGVHKHPAPKLPKSKECIKKKNVEKNEKKYVDIKKEKEIEIKKENGSVKRNREDNVVYMFSPNVTSPTKRQNSLLDLIPYPSDQYYHHSNWDNTCKNSSLVVSDPHYYNYHWDNNNNKNSLPIAPYTIDQQQQYRHHHHQHQHQHHHHYQQAVIHHHHHWDTTEQKNLLPCPHSKPFVPLPKPLLPLEPLPKYVKITHFDSNRRDSCEEIHSRCRNNELDINSIPGRSSPFEPVIYPTTEKTSLFDEFSSIISPRELLVPEDPWGSWDSLLQ